MSLGLILVDDAVDVYVLDRKLGGRGRPPAPRDLKEMDIPVRTNCRENEGMDYLTSEEMRRACLSTTIFSRISQTDSKGEGREAGDADQYGEAPGPCRRDLPRPLWRRTIRSSFSRWTRNAAAGKGCLRTRLAELDGVSMSLCDHSAKIFGAKTEGLPPKIVSQASSTTP